MTHQLQKAQSRLENIQKVEPILSALRTISLGSWQMARNRRRGIQAYTRRLETILELLMLYLAPYRSKGWRFGRKEEAPRSSGRIIVAIIGSERGLCGRYNKVLLDRLVEYLQQVSAATKVDLLALGTRMSQLLQRAGYELLASHSLSLTRLPGYRLAYTLVDRWMREFEAWELDAVDLVYNVDRGAGQYATMVKRLIPSPLPSTGVASTRMTPMHMASDVIVDTDPLSLCARVMVQWTTTTFYSALIEAALTEHAARYQLMESASQNADELVEELMLTVQSARRQAITREMQELAVSAGLLESDTR